MKQRKEVFVLNAQTRNPNRPSLTRKCDCGSGKLFKNCHGTSGGSGPLVKKDEAFCLPTTGGSGQFVISPPSQELEGSSSAFIKQRARGRNKGGAHQVAPTMSSSSWPNNNLLVSGTRRSTSTPRKSMRAISPTTRTSATSPQSTPTLFPTSTSSSEASLARRLASRASGADLRTPEGRSSLMLLGFSPRSDRDTSYWKTSKGFCLMTMDELSKSSSPRLLSWGMASNGKCLTARTSAFPRTGSASSLSDILENNVDTKYFLSAKRSKELLSMVKKAA